MQLPSNTPNNLDVLPITVDNLNRILNNTDSCHLLLSVAENPKLPVHLFYLDGMISNAEIGEMIVRPLMVSARLKTAQNTSDVIRMLEDGILYFPDQKKTDSLQNVIGKLHNGFCALVFDAEQVAFLFETKGFERRGVSPPEDENVIKGAKDAFTETIRTNTATVRRKLGSHQLKIADTTLGTESKTCVSLLYLENIANRSLVESVQKRLNAIQTDHLLSLGMFEELFLPKKRLFPKLMYTERPDKFCACLSEGRVGILIDGFPVGYIVPVELNALMQTPEGYAHSPIMASAIRILLYLLFGVSLSLPALYVAIVTHHPELLPVKLALSLQHSRIGVPFPAFLEVLLLLIAFEILIEAGMRLPKSIGQAVSIVGGLIIGDAVVSAKMMSPVVIVILAVSVIAGYTMPHQDLEIAVRVWRFILVLAAVLGGLFCLAVGVGILLFILADTECFGVPYLAPFAGVKKQLTQDGFLRKPAQSNQIRPLFLHPKKPKRKESRH